MVLQDEQTGFWCHTLLIVNPDKIRFQMKEGLYSFKTIKDIKTHFELTLFRIENQEYGNPF